MDLIEQLETLRIPDSEFFGITQAKRDIYYSMNTMLDDCLEIVYKWLKENNIEV